MTRGPGLLSAPHAGLGRKCTGIHGQSAGACGRLTRSRSRAVRHPGLVTARPPAARHLDGLHPLSPLATTVFIHGFFDRVWPCAHYADAAARVRRHTGRLLGAHGWFLLPGLAPGRRVASPSARPGLSAQAGLASPAVLPAPAGRGGQDGRRRSPRAKQLRLRTTAPAMTTATASASPAKSTAPARICSPNNNTPSRQADSGSKMVNPG